MRRTALLIALAAAFVAMMSGSAMSYWAAAGSGSGAGTTGTTVAVTISPGTPSPTLHPGGTADVTLVIVNSNPTVVSIASLVLDTAQSTAGFAVDVAHSGCVLSTLTFITQSNGGSGWSVPASTSGVDGTLPVTLANALAMDVNAANACQGAVFTIYLAASS
jgi:hypothetical protein